jgi:hypothetical protein
VCVALLPVSPLTSWQSLAQDVPCDETRAIAVIKFFGDHNLSLLREDYTTVLDPQHNFEAYPGQGRDFDNVSVPRMSYPLWADAEGNETTQNWAKPLGGVVGVCRKKLKSEGSLEDSGDNVILESTDAMGDTKAVSDEVNDEG